MARFQRLQYAGQNFAGEGLPTWSIPEELGDIDEDGVEEFVDFPGILADIIGVIGKAADVELKHAPAQAAFKRGLFIAAKVEAAPFGKLLQQVL